MLTLPIFNPTRSNNVSNLLESVGICWNKQQPKDPLFLLLNLAGIGMLQNCGVVGFCWIEQGAQTDPEGGQVSLVDLVGKLKCATTVLKVLLEIHVHDCSA